MVPPFRMNGALQANIQNLLTEELERARLKNPSYSLRSFARRLGMNSGAISGILAGKRRISRKMAVRVCEKLMFSSEEISKLISDSRETSGPLSYKILPTDQFRLISDWYHFAILSLVKTKNFQTDEEWIASRLMITKSEVRAAVERLVRLGLLKKNQSGKWVRTVSHISSTDGVSSTAVRRAHANDLDLARRSLDEDSMERRDFTALTLAMDPRKMLEVRKRIRAFQDELSRFVEMGPTSEVYKLTMQFFPITKTLKSKGEKDE